MCQLFIYILFVDLGAFGHHWCKLTSFFQVGALFWRCYFGIHYGKTLQVNVRTSPNFTNILGTLHTLRLEGTILVLAHNVWLRPVYPNFVERWPGTIVCWLGWRLKLYPLNRFMVSIRRRNIKDGDEINNGCKAPWHRPPWRETRIEPI